ncbi:MAG: glycine oxidase [Chloroflexi bacterium]|nr:MAG: glycine oxidase [Chloroflexota bacterium]
MTQQTEIVLVGGGIVSLSTAYHLAKEGVASLIVEQEAVGFGASGAAAGLVTPLIESFGPDPMTQLGMISGGMHEDLAKVLPDESGIDYHYSPIPILEPAFSEEEAQALRERLVWLQGLDPDVRWVTPSDIRQMDDRLLPGVLGALFYPNEHQAEPYRLVLAFTAAIERMGSSVRYATATGLESNGGSVTGVRLADGSTIGAGRVLLAMGPWTHQAEAWTAHPIPVQPLKGQILKLEVDGSLPAVSVFYGHNYILPKPAGYMIAGTTEELVGFDTQPTAEAREGILELALRFMPSLETARLTEHTACLRPLSADNVPILGQVPGWEGLYVATGHQRQGIILSVVTGRIMADLLLRGRTDVVDLMPFSPDRWGREAS